MRISHLERTDIGVYCKLCHACFPLPGGVVNDPHRLVEAKEQIATRHICGGVRAQHKRDVETRLARPVCTESKVTPIDEHWNREIRRLFSVAAASEAGDEAAASAMNRLG